MIDVLKMIGLKAMPQVDLGTCQNTHQVLRDLSRVSCMSLATSEEGLLLDGPSQHAHRTHRAPKQRGKTRMATLSVLKFNDPYGAERVMVALQGMQERELITLEDAAIVSWPQGNKKPKTRELHGGSAGWGAF
jgi:hypothetical protein